MLYEKVFRTLCDGDNRGDRIGTGDMDSDRNNQNYKHMRDRINRQSEAFNEALWYCKHYGLDWRKHIEPKIERNEVVGYWVLDESLSTTLKTIHL